MNIGNAWGVTMGGNITSIWSILDMLEGGRVFIINKYMINASDIIKHLWSEFAFNIHVL